MVGRAWRAPAGGEVGRAEARHSALSSSTERLLYKLRLAGWVDPPEGALPRLLLGSRNLHEIPGSSHISKRTLKNLDPTCLN